MNGEQERVAADVALTVFGPLFETSPHPMVVYDELFRMVAVNRAYEEFVQRPQAELIGQLPDPERYRLPDGGGQLSRLILGTADGCLTEVEITRPDGTVAWATVLGQAVRDDAGALQHIGLQLTDVTSIRVAQRDLAYRVEIASAIRDASAQLAARSAGDLSEIVRELCTRFTDVDSVGSSVRVGSVIAAWQDLEGACCIVAVGPDGTRVHTAHGNAAATTLALADSDTIASEDVPGLSDWSSTTLDAAGIGGADATGGWVAMSAICPGTNLGEDLDALGSFVEQAVQRVSREDGDHRRMRLQAFVNQTAADFLAHRFTGDRQEVLVGTLAGLADIIVAHNAQFRTNDWDRMVSETLAEFVADGHSETDDAFRTLDLNEPLYRDIAGSTEPLSFEIDGMRGQTVSVLNVPLVVEGVVTATLNLAGNAGRKWSEFEMEACRSVAGLMVQLQRRIDLERILAQRLRLGELVNQVATEFNDATADAADGVIADALATTAMTLDTPRIALWRHDRKARTATIDWMWELGVGGTSLADIVEIDVNEHPPVAALFESTAPVTLTPEEIPTGFGDVPEDLHLLYVPIARSGEARLALSVENWGAREWSDAEIEAVQSVAQLIAQLTARVEAENAMVKRLRVEDITRTIATNILQLTNQTSLEGIRDALGSIGAGLELDRAALCIIDHRESVVTIVTEWRRDEDPAGNSDAALPFDGVLAVLAEQSNTVVEMPARGCEILAGPDSSVGLVAPLARASERTTGLLVFERVDHKPWTSEDRRAIDVVGSLMVQLGARLQAENYFATAFENAPVGISLRDSDERLLACNRAYEQFVGQTQEELIGTTVTGSLKPEYTTDPEVDEREFRLERPNGTHVWGRVTEAKVRAASDRGDLWLRHITDITATRQAMEQLEYQAGHDELTGLANRRVLMDQLRTCLQPVPQPTDAAVLLLDVDRFKIINDSLGHSIGDDVLRVIADRLRLAVRPDDVVCRLGGDEFVVLLRGPVSGIESAAVATRLLELLGEPIEVGPTRMLLTASIGIANPTAGDTALEDVLRHADSAMYTAKSKGRSRFEVFDQRHRDALAHRLEIESDLRQAIENRALELHFQPEIELVSGRLLGAEALVRWPHPRLGMLTAGSFIEVAEETGQVVELGRMVLDMACQQAAEWNALGGSPLVMRVNLSAHQVDRPELVDEVRQAIEKHGLRPEQLCLEITETAIMSHVDESQALLERLREVGVQLAIDDFGTGFSSLAYLKRFPVDILKIDQTFVRGLGCDRDDDAIVRSVISMAAALDLDVVAEGIETAEQRAILLEMGCYRGQGFGLARPTPAEDLAPLLESRSIDVSCIESAT